MSLTDPIADMLTRIRNVNTVKKEKVDIPSSGLKQDIARVLKEQGYISNYKNITDRKQGILRIYLKYTPDKKPVIRKLLRVSRPGLRKYANREKLPRVQRGLGIAIVSTSKGVMTDKQARRARVGGEILCYIW